MAIDYLDFDLAIEAIDASPGRYRARVLHSPAGEANVEFELPFSALELENYILKMGRPRQGVRGLNSTEGRAAQEFGRKVYEAIFQGEVRDCLRRSLDVTTQQPDQGLRLRLRLTAAPALADWPWEYLYDPSFRRFFAHSAATPIVRYLDLSQRIQPLTVQPPLKILVMIANPRDVGQLDVEAEWRKVQAALADLVARGLVTLTRLEKATLAALQRQLRHDQYHIFHFVGHGGFDEQHQEGVLLLEQENGLVRMVAGSYIGTLLHDHRSLRLAVLNSCEGARTAQSDPFAGVAQILVQQGIPAVIAMQFEITDEAAITFAHEFYTALADRYPVDGALAEARKAIYADGNDVEWGTPVLYLRAQNGNIFAIAEPHEAPPLPRVEPEPVKPTPPKSIFQAWSYPVWAIFILFLIGGIWLGPRFVASLQQLINGTPTPTSVSPTLTPTLTATVTAITPTPDLTATAAADFAAQTAVAATKIALAPTATITPTAIATLAPTATATVTPTTVVTPTATATLTSTPTVINTPTSTATDTPIPAPTVTETPLSTSTPAEPAIGATKIIEGVTFVYVPEGEFMMGSSDAQIDAAWQECQKTNKDCPRVWFENEAPQQSFDVPGFWIMRTEVTNAQYKRCVDAGKCTAPDNDSWDKSEFSNYPITDVDLHQAKTFAEWMGGSLPTEAQWEKAACGTDGGIYPWGNDAPDDKFLNYKGNIGHTTEVGSYPQGQSPYGALDMAGNVWEWTSSQYQPYPYQVDDGREDLGGEASRVLRGGAFGDNDFNVRCADRGRVTPDIRYNHVGFRVVSPGF